MNTALMISQTQTSHRFFKSTVIVSVLVNVALTTGAQNLVSSSSWTVSSGSIGIFNANGNAAANVREIGTDPFGNQSILWKGTPDGIAQPNGGWDSSPFTIDPSKLYRYSVWIKKTNSNEGHTYVGCQANLVADLSGNVHSNPYFFVGDLPELNKWFLVVGYIHAYNDPSTSNYGGVYDGVTGAKVAGTSDFKFTSTATTGTHRTYLYYDYNINDRQYFFGPEVYQCVGPMLEAPGGLIAGNTSTFTGNVGIGSGFPLAKLDVNLASSFPGINMSGQGSTPNQIFMQGSDGGGPVFSIRDGNSGNTLGGMVIDGYRRSDNPGVYLSGRQVVGNGAGAATTEGTIDLRAYSYTDQTFSALSTPHAQHPAFKFRFNNADLMTMTGGGQVGIGTSSPDSKLSVRGKIHAQEVQVDLNGAVAPDYVFEKDYKLPSLEEIQSYITANKHLPEVPSAKEMEEKGIVLGEMNLLLLKKIEELTLYSIQQEASMRELKSQMSGMQEELRKLKK